MIWCETSSRSGLVQLVGNFGEVGMVALQFGIGNQVHMSGTREGLPMDVAKDARWQQEQEEQEQEQKRELDRNDLVRARLVAISQVEPVGDVVPVDAIKESQAQAQAHPQPSPKGDAEDEFRRKLMSISYTDVPLPAQ